MACSGAHCTNHNTGTAGCVGHRPACATNRPLTLSSDFATENRRVRASDVNNLRVNIRNDLAAFNVSPYYSWTILMPDPIVTQEDIDNLDPNQLYTMTNQVIGDPPESVPNLDPIDDVFWDTIRDQYNIVRQMCICDTDCACDNVCACHNDCGCHYSDRRLKKDIEYC